MRNKCLGILLTILFAISLMISSTLVAAKPIKPNPEHPNWAPGVWWGTRLRLENAYKSNAWFGTGADDNSPQPPAPSDGYLVGFIVAGTEYSKITYSSLRGISPGGGASDNWQVRMRAFGDASSTATISSVMENADTAFVPPEFSVVLENTALGLKVNLRKENGTITGIGPVYARLYVDNAVNVSISPSYQEGKVGENLAYTITVKNTGRYNDNYSLSVSDNLGWELSLDNNLLRVPAGENRTTKLHVLIENCTSDIVTVTADGVYASDSDRTTATVPPHAVELTVEPTYQSAEPFNWLEYTVTVHNVGLLSDNYNLGVTDNLHWDNIYLDNTELENIRPCENKQTTLHVHVPYCVEGGTEDNITVTATSRADNSVSDNNSCIAHVAIVRGVEVSISPSWDNGAPYTTLDYTITIKNTGNVADNYNLSWSDNAGWGDNIWLDNVSLTVGGCGENKQTTLHVYVPYCVEGGTEDNITVTASSQADPAVSDNASCIAHVAITRGIEISISPSYQGALPTETLYYIVRVKNTGNVDDNYDLSVSDNAGWNPTLVDNLLENVPFCENRQVMLSVVVPDNEPGTLDNIVVTATSRTEPSISTENYCTAVVFAEFNLNCLAGWNLVGFQVTNAGMTPNNLFAGLTFTMYYWDAPFGPYNEPSKTLPVEDNRGYWVKLNQDNMITFTGVRQSSRTMYFLTGWNLVNFPLTSLSTTPNNLFAGKTFTMYYWQAPYGPYNEPNYNMPVEDNRGYWIKVNENYSVTIPL